MFSRFESAAWWAPFVLVSSLVGTAYAQTAEEDIGDEVPKPSQDAPAPELAPPPPPNNLSPAPSSPTDTSNEISLDDFNRNDWVLVQPKVTLLELDGYFRVRGDMFRRMDFGNNGGTEQTFDDPNLMRSRYPRARGEDANFIGTNMRLRLDPQINVTDEIQIISTIDVLDNLILGSTPLVYNLPNGTPANILADGQRVPLNVADMIAIKRLFARVTALNEQLELRVGRQPQQFGLGMYANNGDCLDCNYGDVADRLSLSFKLADHQFVAMYDFVTSGPRFFPFAIGQSVDLVPWDDTDQISVQAMKLDPDADIQERVLAGETVFNYGAWGIWRRQYRDLAPEFFDVDGEDELDEFGEIDDDQNLSDRRNSNIFTVDAFAKLYSGGLTLGAEAVGIFGGFDSRLATERVNINVRQLGVALEADYKLAGDYAGTKLSLKSGAASGDRARGFGALNRAGSQVNGTDDRELRNFNFSPDYHVDLLLFRNIIGTVTDAWYVRPAAAYTFDNNFTGSLAAIYSQAFMKKTPVGVERPLGVELDAELSYASSKTPEGGALMGSLAGGILFPFAGFDNQVDPGTDEGASFAWTVQARMYITF